MYIKLNLKFFIANKCMKAFRLGRDRGFESWAYVRLCKLNITCLAVKGNMSKTSKLGIPQKEREACQPALVQRGGL